MSRSKRFREKIKPPFRTVFADWLRNRRVVLLVCGSVAIYLILSLMGYRIWLCPIYSATGIHCPGCGLTQAIREILHGHWYAGIQQHAFSPVFVAGFVIVTIISLLPENLNRKCVACIMNIEQRSGFFFFLMVLLVLYWFVRLGCELFN
ncbi:MAG TPA: DUF2752 domain-containing protein [bacterium]|nr:DUF2752 domain-containing protein [bacterium]HPN43504.1 DUF2752 domain-containing protein [bacterium]